MIELNLESTIIVPNSQFLSILYVRSIEFTAGIGKRSNETAEKSNDKQGIIETLPVFPFYFSYRRRKIVKGRSIFFPTLLFLPVEINPTSKKRNLIVHLKNVLEGPPTKDEQTYLKGPNQAN